MIMDLIPQAHSPWKKKTIILIPISLFASLGRRGLSARIEGPFDSRAKAPLAKRREKGHGDENGRLSDSSSRYNCSTF